MARNVSSKFGVAEGLDFSTEQGIVQIGVDKLIPYSKHRFTLYEGERLEDMKQSISKNGVMTPIIVRTTDNGKYEILAGHNRVYAAKSAGLTEVPAVVKTGLSDEEAEIYVVETNLLQRGFSELKISEQAFAVAMRYEKLFDMGKLKSINDELYLIENGKRPDVEDEGEAKSSTGASNNSRDITAAEYGISHATVARLLRINTLIDELKELVDRKNIKIRPAVDISYMSEEQQKMLYSLMEKQGVTVIDMKMSKQLRELAASYTIVTEELISEVLSGTYGGEEAPEKEKGEKITLPKAVYTRYLGGYSKKEANEIIEKALAKYFDETEDNENGE